MDKFTLLPMTLARASVGKPEQSGALGLALFIAGMCGAPTVALAADAETWNARLQSTYIWQHKPALSSPYEGPHSLTATREDSYSLTATAAFGLRPAQRTELYFDPEMAQGIPLSGLQGLAGFTNGEMARSSGSRPVFYRARLFMRQTFDLGNERDSVESAMNQLGGEVAKRRVVVSAGFVPVMDIFDANTYAHDARSQFLNWSFMTYTAYDYAADARGYTWGAAAEYFDDGWAARIGRFAQPKNPNGLALDTHIGEHYGDQIELERHYALGDDRPGAVRILAYRNRAIMARYSDALALSAQTGEVPDLNIVRSGEHVKMGVGVSVEQQLAPDFGGFARAMWADGRTETYAFTESDRSLAAGAVLTGQRWHREKDSVGFALAESLLSSSHRQLLADGGQTFFLGNGRLHYGPERVAEAYYLLAPTPGVALTFDYQRIWSPGYNQNRGPASFYAIRLHVEN